MSSDQPPPKRTIQYRGMEIITRLPDELAFSIADELMRARVHLELADELTIKAMHATRGDSLYTIVLTRGIMRIVESDPD